MDPPLAAHTAPPRTRHHQRHRCTPGKVTCAAPYHQAPWPQLERCAARAALCSAHMRPAAGQARLRPPSPARAQVPLHGFPAIQDRQVQAATLLRRRGGARARRADGSARVERPPAAPLGGAGASLPAPRSPAHHSACCGPRCRAPVQCLIQSFNRWNTKSVFSEVSQHQTPDARQRQHAAPKSPMAPLSHVPRNTTLPCCRSTSAGSTQTGVNTRPAT